MTGDKLVLAATTWKEMAEWLKVLEVRAVAESESPTVRSMSDSELACTRSKEKELVHARASNTHSP